MEKAYERTEGRVGKLVLRLYYAGYDPTVIARIIIAHAIEFVILCGGPDINPEPLRTARAALAELLMLEHSRRRLTPAYDAVGQYLERW